MKWASFAENILKRIFFIEKAHLPIKISPNIVPWCPIDKKSALVRIMAWCWTSDKPLSEPMMDYFTDAYVPSSESALIWNSMKI